MKLGDLVQWYSESTDPVEDLGFVTKVAIGQVHVIWFSGDSNGWYLIGHPSIGVISESR